VELRLRNLTKKLQKFRAAAYGLDRSGPPIPFRNYPAQHKQHGEAEQCSSWPAGGYPGHRAGSEQREVARTILQLNGWATPLT